MLGLAAYASAQWTSGYGYSSFNPLSGTINTLSWDSYNSRLVYKIGLKEKGFTDAQLENMSTDELMKAYYGAGIAKKQMDEEDGKEKKAPIAAKGAFATQFKPSGKRVLMPAIIDSLTEDAGQRKELVKIFGQTMDAYEAEAKKANLENDIAGAIGFFAGMAFMVQDGQVPDEDGMSFLTLAIRSELNTPEIKKISSLDKQKFYEFMLTMGSYLLLSEMSLTEEDKDTKAALKDVSKDVLIKFLGIDPSKVMLTSDGLVKRPE